MHGKHREESIAKFAELIPEVEAVSIELDEQLKTRALHLSWVDRWLVAQFELLRRQTRMIRFPGDPDPVAQPAGPLPTNAGDPVAELHKFKTRLIAKLCLASEAYEKQEAQRGFWEPTIANFQLVFESFKQLRELFLEQSQESTDDCTLQNQLVQQDDQAASSPATQALAEDATTASQAQAYYKQLEMPRLATEASETPSDAASEEASTGLVAASEVAAEEAFEGLPLVPMSRMLTQEADDDWNPFAVTEEPTTPWPAHAATFEETHGAPATAEQLPLLPVLPVIAPMICFQVFNIYGPPVQQVWLPAATEPTLLLQPIATQAWSLASQFAPQGYPEVSPQVAGHELKGWPASMGVAVSGPNNLRQHSSSPSLTDTKTPSRARWADESSDSEEAADNRQPHALSQTQAQLWNPVQPGQRGELTCCIRCERIYDSVLSCAAHGKNTSLCHLTCAAHQRRAVGCFHFHRRGNCNRSDCKFCHC